MKPEASLILISRAEKRAERTGGIAEAAENQLKGGKTMKGSFLKVLLALATLLLAGGAWYTWG